MAYSTLRDFLNALDEAGELHRVKSVVSPILEMTEITDRQCKARAATVSDHARLFDPHHADRGGRALLFESVELPGGSTGGMPVLMNAYGSYHRMEMALGVTGAGLTGLAEKIGAILKPQVPATLAGKFKKGYEMIQLAGISPKCVRQGHCQEVVHGAGELNLLDLPVLKCWPGDGDPRSCGYDISPAEAGTDQGMGRFITFGMMHTIHPDDAGQVDSVPQSHNVGIYRAQLIDRNHAAMHWHMHHDGARYWRAWKKTGRPMPLAISFGGESVLPYAATAPLPPGVSEMMFAGFLHGGGINMVKCSAIDLHVPAGAELVIEGYVSTESLPPGVDDRVMRRGGDIRDHIGPGAVLEGPFGDHTGYYSMPDRYPVFEVTAITHRKQAIYPATVVGLPPQEDYYLGKASERLFLPVLKAIVPDLVDYDLPMFGAFHNCVFISIRKEYPLQARRVMHAVWGLGQLAWTKIIMVVDDDVNVHDYEEVLFHWSANCDPKRDSEIVHGPVDILDHASPMVGCGHKIGFDATRKIRGEQVNGVAVRDWPMAMKMTEQIRQQVNRRWREYGFLSD